MQCTSSNIEIVDFESNMFSSGNDDVFLRCISVFFRIDKIERVKLYSRNTKLTKKKNIVSVQLCVISSHFGKYSCTYNNVRG